MSVTLALIGLGDHMLYRLYPMLVRYDINLVAVCDSNPARLSRFAGVYQVPRQYLSIEDLLSQETPDGVVCAGPAQMHYEAAKQCMLHGISPFIEKTPCATAGQSEELLQIEQSTGCFTMTGFNRRYATAYTMGKQLISADTFGAPTLYTAKYNASPYPSAAYFLLNHVTHHLDIARYFMGEIATISGLKKTISEREVCLHINFTTVSGAMGFIQSASIGCEAYPMERIEVIGLRENVIIDNVKSLEHNRRCDGLMDVDVQPQKLESNLSAMWNVNHGHSSLYGHYGFERELGIYIHSIANNSRPQFTMADTVKTMRLYHQLLTNTKEI